MFNFTIKNLLKKSTTEAELLLAQAIHKNRIFVLSHPEYQLSLAQYWRFVYYLFLFNQGYSIATITKHKEFFGLDFLVNKHVLIPRPETELMVENVLNEIKNSSKKILLIDVGTGSGCIPISILKNSQNISQTIALDISNPALKIAKKNITRHGVDIQLLKSNLLTKIFKRDYSSFDQIIITANLPYLTNEQIQTEPSIQKEPHIALFAKENGLALYRQLLKQTADLFSNKKLLILLEIDPTQSTQIKQLTEHYLPRGVTEIKKDLAGLDRILKIST